MVAINFMPQFAEAVEDGSKRQTIRANARCKPGDRLQLYTGMRTKTCRKLMDAICIRVRPVMIDSTDMELDGTRLIAGNALRDEPDDRDNDFAEKDGFKSFMDMADWFRKTHGDLPFHGFVIEWREA